MQEQEAAIRNHEYNLRLFIDMTMRYSIDMVYSSRTEHNPLPFFDNHFKNLQPYFDAFDRQLRIEVDKLENGNAFENDIKNKFLPMMFAYKNWYETKEDELKKFEPYNFYRYLYENIESTEQTINTVFPTNQTPIEIVLYIVSYFDKNPPGTQSPDLFTRAIKRKLERVNKSPYEAYSLLTNYKSTFHQDYFERVVKPLIGILDELDKADLKFNAPPRQTETKGKQPEAKKLNELFTITDWEKYVEVFTQCQPKLLKKENGLYEFIGNNKTQKGVIASWFKFLKTKGIINQSYNRDTIAKTLSIEIKNYSINGSSIDNVSESYEETFEPQLLQITRLNK